MMIEAIALTFEAIVVRIVQGCAVEEHYWELARQHYTTYLTEQTSFQASQNSPRRTPEGDVLLNIHIKASVHPPSHTN
jgi:hypothetical protein